MTAQKGKDLLLKVDSDGGGTFVTVGGLRARSLAFNAATVDATDQESAGRWRELLAGAGLKSARLSGSGIFKDAASDETLRQYFFGGTVRVPWGLRPSAPRWTMLPRRARVSRGAARRAGRPSPRSGAVHGRCHRVASMMRAVGQI
jgi:hypothetical protein